MHVDGIMRHEAMRLMMEDAFQEEREAAGKWTRAQLTSGQLSTYFVGYLEHVAMRRDADWDLPVIAIDDPQAANYLTGLPFGTTERGWHIVQWRQRPLGWVKCDGRTAKNHLPKSARSQSPLK